MIPVPKIRDVDIAFGNIKHLPDPKDIPEMFQRDNKWEDVVSQWFYGGLGPETEFIPKEGVDPKEAIRAIKAILISYEPKHEHKLAGCAYLLSEWFEDIKVVPRKK